MEDLEGLLRGSAAELDLPREFDSSASKYKWSVPRDFEFECDRYFGSVSRDAPRQGQKAISMQEVPP